MSLIGLLRHPTDGSQAVEPTIPENRVPRLSDPCAEQLLRTGRYCQLLCDSHDGHWERDALRAATTALEHEMALVPAGSTTILAIASSDMCLDRHQPVDAEPSIEDAFFMDRLTVTNAQFERFVQAGGYRQEEYWPEDILPLIFQFVDQTGKPGPKTWRDGHPPREQRNHPVVGVCWYEANAYALWAGKRLATSAQWQRAGTWWKPQVRYPWGNGFEPDRANIALARHAGTVSAAAYPNGATPNGIQQLIGNVWEWVYASIEQVYDDDDLKLLAEPLGEIRGGAFDTYLPSQANCLFRSGQPLLKRATNVGFRCCVPAHALPLEREEASEL